jgi:hypothetical protein
MVEFTQDQREELGQQGLTTEQIDALLKALPECQFVLSMETNKPRLNDVKKLLQDILRDNNKAARSMRKPLRPKDSAGEEALTKLDMASFEIGGDGTEIERALHSLAVANAIVKRAISRLPRQPQRHQTATFEPVRLIHVAAPFLVPSSGVKSQFMAVVGICYDAILGTDFHDPERVVKGYCAWLRTERHK